MGATVSWPTYHTATDEDRNIRRQATAIRALVMLGWHAAYARQRTELRKAKEMQKRERPPEGGEPAAAALKAP